MLMGYRQQIGSITCSVMMDILNQKYPQRWLLAVYIEYAMIGIMFLCYIFIPETPWYFARRGDREGAMKSMRRLYGNIPDYDYEHEYGIISRTIAHEKEMNAIAKAQPWSEIFRGLNGVSRRLGFVGRGATYAHRNVHSSLWSCARVNK